MLLHLQQNQPPEGSVQGKYQIVVPLRISSPATAGSSQQVLVQRVEGDPLKMPPRELSVQWQVIYYDTLAVLQLTIGSYISMHSSRYEACRKFGEHERSVRLS